MDGGSGIHLCQTVYHPIICLGSPKPRMTTLLYITSLLFFKVVFYFQLLRRKKTINLVAIFVCPSCNGCFVSSQKPFWLAFWWVYSPSPNASLQLHTEDKDSFLGTRDCRGLTVPCSHMWYTHFNSRNCISPLNMYKSLYKQIPLHSLKRHSALETCLPGIIAESD